MVWGITDKLNRTIYISILWTSKNNILLLIILIWIKKKKIEDYCFSVVHCCFAFGNILWLYILLLMLPSLNIFSSSFIAYKKYGFILSKIFKIRLDYGVIINMRICQPEVQW